MKFNKYSFAELLTNIVDNRGKTCPVVDHGIPLIATNCIKNEGLYAVYEKLRYVDQETYKNWFRGHPLPNDIIFVCKGSPGRVAWVQDPVPYCIAQDMLAIRANEDLILSKYLFALLRSPVTQKSIENMHVGTLIPHFKKGDFKSLYLDVPEDKNFQALVGNLHFSLNEKIEINKVTNSTLEQIAQAIFKSWFVDFEPTKAKIAAREALLAENPAATPEQIATAEQQAAIQAIAGAGDIIPTEKLQTIADLFPNQLVDSELGEIPEGWKVNSLIELINITGGGTPKRSESAYWGGNIAWFSVKDVPNSSDIFVIDTDEKITELGLKRSSTKLIPKGSTIITARGTVGKLALVAENMCMNQSCYAIRGKRIGDFFNYFNLRQSIETLQRNTHGAVFDTITTKTFETYSLAFGGDEISYMFDTIVDPIMKRIELNVRQNNVLGEVRDALLPKLLSGQIEIA